MILADVNVLVYAHREDAQDHRAYRSWLESTVNSDHPFGICGLVLSGFLRLVTHPRIFKTPTPLNEAVSFVEQLRAQPNAVFLEPGVRHWDIFIRLCEEVEARGNLVPDAYFAALAIESGTEWITTDRDFSRFPGLNWRHPLKDG
jgi:toxin-antitoxin system PIN domain toxin